MGDVLNFISLSIISLIIFCFVIKTALGEGINSSVIGKWFSRKDDELEQKNLFWALTSIMTGNARTLQRNRF